MFKDLLLLRTQPSPFLGAGERHRARTSTKQPGEHIDRVGQVPAAISVNIAVLFGRRLASSGEGRKLVGDNAKQRGVQNERG